FIHGCIANPPGVTEVGVLDLALKPAVILGMRKERLGCDIGKRFALWGRLASCYRGASSYWRRDGRVGRRLLGNYNVRCRACGNRSFVLGRGRLIHSGSVSR